MTRKPPSPAEINMRNAQFWAAEQDKLQARLSDQSVAGYVLSELAGEAARGVPVQHQESLESCVERATTFKTRILSERAAAAAKRPRMNRLQAFVVELVTADPTMSCSVLLERLREQIGQGIVEDIDEDSIGFIDERGRGQSAPLSGLKDRLSRAKGHIRSR